ncbi:MAG: hypothetical protein HC890_04055 [Chloroflexaceae bacterium]|nr:hypothetical protein [Chloroflexaceae bacterium]
MLKPFAYLLLSGSFSLLPAAVFAQAAPETVPVTNYGQLSEVFNRAFFGNTGDFFHQISYGEQINYIFGFEPLINGSGSFPENEVAADAQLLSILHQDALARQAESGPLLFTRDLPNPYTTSLLTEPSLIAPLFGDRVIIIDSQPLP